MMNENAGKPMYICVTTHFFNQIKLNIKLFSVTSSFLKMDLALWPVGLSDSDGGVI